MAINDITRADVASMIAEEYSADIIKASITGSLALAAFPHTSMGTKTTHMPVVATMPEATWVSESAEDDEGTKPTSKGTWTNAMLVAEEVAVIIPVHENVLEDATADMLTEISAMGGAALGKKLDQAVLFGTNKPASWTSPALLPAAVAAGQTYQPVTGKDDLYGAIIQAARDANGDVYNASVVLASSALRLDLLNLRGSDGHLVLTDDALRGFDATHFSRNGAWDKAQALALICDPNFIRIGIRQDVTVKFLDQATVGGINLAEKDMVALRFKARYAYVLGMPNGTPVGAVVPPVVPPAEEPS
ncbi:MAG: phage major capsid protein [Propionibacteriaceae bacterium]|jgi:HK97 family phage major capsid protein|nr:phage major capsid protein [Propionibacteriaceae bacterium]